MLIIVGGCASVGVVPIRAQTPALLEDSHNGKYWLTAFPQGPKPVAIPLKPDGWPYKFGPSGRTLYGVVQGNCLYRLDLKSNQGDNVACPTGLQFSVYSGDVAISQREDRALIFAASQSRNCGVFEILLPNGPARLVTDVGCSDRPTGPGFSCAPDCAFATFIHHKTLYVLNVATGTFSSLGMGFLAASWSPDGKWIAALEDGRRPVTILFDGATLQRQKTLPESETQWSADSLHLLRVRGCWGREDGTVEVLSVITGKTKAIKSSRCQIYQLGTGWVSNGVLPQSSPARTAFDRNGTN